MARMRSPNFPQLTLEECLKITEELYSRVRKVAIDREAAAKELGYSGLTGRSLKILGALNQFGLIDNLKGGQCRVTELAEDALHGFPESKKISAIQRAARSPKLFSAIYDEFGEGIQSEHAIRSFLLKRGFTDRGVEGALQSFLETQSFAQSLLDESDAADDAPYEGEDEPSAEGSHDGETKIESVDRPTKQTNASTFDQHGPLDFQLTSSGLAISGTTNSAVELSKFIKKLEALKTLLPEAEVED